LRVVFHGNDRGLLHADRHAYWRNPTNRSQRTALTLTSDGANFWTDLGACASFEASSVEVLVGACCSYRVPVGTEPRWYKRSQDGGAHCFLLAQKSELLLQRQLLESVFPHLEKLSEQML
jgi:hypothetical protein